MYDYVIIELCKDSFSASEMQFGFKENHSTTMCTVILREVIQNYIEGHIVTITNNLFRHMIQ